ncbi:MAG: hypothetical protein J2P43_06675 [Candidatus Dormibacteraeota bacterium]|nr:hypothetical protein [Candidatus Dormibacteraeota bacterium]
MKSEELIQQVEALARRQEELVGRKNRVDRMQPGEDPDSGLPEDAAHWTTVYQELIRFKRDLVAEVEAKMEADPEPAVREELVHDRDILRSELERLVLHEAFWSERALPPA